MPVIKFEIAELERLLGKSVPREQLARDIPMLGADPDDVKGDTWAIEFFPDRPDLYTVEGIARALRAWYGVKPGLPHYQAKKGSVTVTVEPSVEKVRPHIQAAFVRGVNVTDARLQALIDLQEDLHWGIGARRRRVAIGVHDAGALAAPFTYTTWGLDEKSFVPLADTREMTPREILAKHPKGTEYAHLLAGHARVPIILDSKGGVVSMPPIINAARTTVAAGQRDLFLDVTGTDEWAVGRALNLLATSLAESGAHLETVDIIHGGKHKATPDLAPEHRKLGVAETNAHLGTAFNATEIAQKLERMAFGARAAADGATVDVAVPCYRADILHAWDLIEDVAIGHGIDSFTPLPLRAPTTGAALPENKVAALARQSLIGLGFLETMGLTITNPRDQFERMQRPHSGAVVVKNPVTEDHTMLRTSLLPGLLSILKRNAHRDLPQRVFEAGMVTHIRHGGDVVNERRVAAGAREASEDQDASPHVVNERRVAGVIVQGRSNFSEIKGIALAVARDLSWGDAVVAKADDPAFVAGRCGALTTGKHHRGVFGELSPAVLEAFGIGHPVTAFEFHLGRGPGEHVRGPHP